MFEDDIIDDQIHDVSITANLVSWSKFRGGLILDIGGSLGYFAKAILDYYPLSRIVSIEPSKTNFNYLVENVKELNVLPIHAAVTNGEESIKFYENNNPNQGTIFLGDYHKTRMDRFVDEYEVRGLDFQKLVHILKPNLIKIDIEGYELFLNYSNLPSSVNTIVMEVHMSDKNPYGEILPGIVENDIDLYSEIIEDLKSQGFEYHKMGENPYPWSGAWEGDSQTHLLCMSRKS